MAKISDLLASGFGGVLPMMMARDYKRQQAQQTAQDAAEAERQKAVAASATGQPMKKGGAVKAKGWGKARGARGARVY